MLRDGPADGLGHAILLGDIAADVGVRALDLVGHRLADVVQQGAGLADLDVGADLGGQHRGDPRGEHAFLEDVAAVAGAEAQVAQLLDQLWVQAAHTGLKHRLFARFLQDLVHLLAGLLHHLLDTGRVDAAIDNQLGQRDPGDLAPDGVEARKRHRFRRVVDDQVDARGLLQRTDVSSLAADETTLHLIIGQRNGGDCGLCNYISSQALNGHNHVLAGIVVRFVLVLLLQLPVLAGKLVPRFVFGLSNHLIVGLRD